MEKTPEEIASEIIKKNSVHWCGCSTCQHYREQCIRETASAIREAAKQMQEACVKIAEDNRFGWDEYHESNGFSCATAIAEAIKIL